MGSLPVKKPHAVCIPFPAQGHINPMLKLAKILHTKAGFHITFVNTVYNHRRLLNSRGPTALDGLPDFRFETIPDGLPDTAGDATQDVPSLCESTRKNCSAPFRDLLLILNNNTNTNSSSSSPAPPVTCVISDGVMSCTLEVAEEFRIPAVLFWTTSACGFMGYIHYQKLIDRGLTPLRDVSDLSNGYLDTPVDGVHGMKNMRLRDFPSFIRTTDPDDIMLNFLNGEAQRAQHPAASAIVLNTFDSLEHEVLSAMASMLPKTPLYTVGPLSLLSDDIPKGPIASIYSNLWKEDTDCLRWLGSRAPRSVVYVNFGSITVMTGQQMVEFAWGLAGSGYDFLWVIRPDLVRGDAAVLPEEFVVEVEKRGFMVGWCPQEDVLRHPSVGAFLTHSGWNSTIESLCGGVPMICWPFFGEQQTNCRYACEEWGVGMEIDSDVKRWEVEGLVQEVMGGGEKGREMQRRAFEWKERAVNATRKGGSSFRNLEGFFRHLASLPRMGPAF